MGDNLPVTDARTDQEAAVPLWCAVIALVVVSVPVILAIQAAAGHPSGLVRMANTEPIAPYALAADPDFQFVDIGAHYDGVYYYAIARDPFAQGEAHTLIDKASYRYGHAGYGWLAGLVSLGRPALIPHALVFIGVISLAVAAWAVANIFQGFGLSGWWGLTIPFNPGLIYAATATTSEPLGAAVLSVGLLFWLRGRIVPAAAFFVALCLIKEPFVVVPVALAGYELLRKVRGRPRPDMWKRIGLLSIGPLLFAIWYLYLIATFDTLPFKETEGFFQFPYAGWIESIRQAAALAEGPFYESQLGAPSVAFIAVIGGLTIFAIVRALRLRSPVQAIFLPLVAIDACLSPLGVLYPKDLIRELAIPLLLIPLVLAEPRSALEGASLDHDDIAQPPER